MASTPQDQQPQQQQQQQQEQTTLKEQQQQQQSSGSQFPAPNEWPKKIIVTGASGHTGLAVCKYLRRSSKNWQIRAAVPPKEVGAESHERALSQLQELEVCECNANDSRTCVDPMRGCDVCVLITTSHADKIKHAENFVRAAIEADVPYVILISMVLADQGEYSWAEEFSQIERCLHKSGAKAFTILRTNFYMQNFLLYDEQVRNGELPLPIGTGKMSPMDTEDIGRLVTYMLEHGVEQHIGKIYNMTGPESLDGPQMAAMASRGLNRDIKFVDIAADEAKRILQSKGMPQTELDCLMDYYAKVEQGTLNVISYDTSNLTGKPSVSLQQFFEKHRDEFTKSESKASESKAMKGGEDAGATTAK